MFERLKKSATAPTPETLETKTAAALAEVARLREEMAQRALDAHEGIKGSADALAQTEAALAKAEASARRLEAAAAPAQARKEAAAQKAAAAELARKWDKAAAIAKERTAVAQQLERSLTETAALYKRLLQLGDDIFTTAPWKDSDYVRGSYADSSDLQFYFQLQLAREGLVWALTLPPSTFDSYATLSKRIADGNAVLLSKRPK